MSEDVSHTPNWYGATAAPRQVPGVDSMVGYQVLSASAFLHHGLPSSRLTFILALDDGIESASTMRGLDHARPAPVLVGGLHTAASYVRQPPGQAGIQLSVHPLAARTVLGLPASELPVTEFDGRRVLSHWATQLHEQLVETVGWDVRFGLVRDQLLRRVRDLEQSRFSQQRAELVHAWHLLARSGGRMRIEDLASAVGLSSRHLATLFRAEVGRSPKQVSGLMRFERASGTIAHQIHCQGHADLAGIATEVGYSDQAHLSREFTRYAGIGPASWISHEFRNIQDGAYTSAADWPHD